MQGPRGEVPVSSFSLVCVAAAFCLPCKEAAAVSVMKSQSINLTAYLESRRVLLPSNLTVRHLFALGFLCALCSESMPTRLLLSSGPLHLWRFRRRHFFPQRGRQIDLMVLLVHQYLPDLLGHRIFSQ
jgi:hypothetical protein